MSRIRMPAMRATIGVIWAMVSVMEGSPGSGWVNYEASVVVPSWDADHFVRLVMTECPPMRA
jgi:hypothetical protein